MTAGAKARCPVCGQHYWAETAKRCPSCQLAHRIERLAMMEARKPAPVPLEVYALPDPFHKSPETPTTPSADPIVAFADLVRARLQELRRCGRPNPGQKLLTRRNLDDKGDNRFGVGNDHPSWPSSELSYHGGYGAEMLGRRRK